MTKLNKEQKIAAALVEAEAKIAATTVAAQTNSQAITALGTKAIERWTAGDIQTKAGDSCAIFAILEAQLVMSFDFVVTRKKEDTSESFTCDIFDLLDEGKWKHSDGTNDRQKLIAAQTAVGQKLFGQAELSDAQKQAIFRRALPTALYVFNTLEIKSLEQLREMVTLETIDGIEMLSLPRKLVIDEPAEDASPNDKKIYELTKDAPIQLDGKQGNSVATLRDKAKPKRKPQQKQEGTDKGASLLASVKMVATVVAEWNNADATTDLAPNAEMRQQLFALAQSIAAYFAADPMEDEASVAA